MVTTPRTRLTYKDYANTPDDERYELIDGELITARLNEKRKLYAAHGVKEYLVMDPSNKIVWRLGLKEGEGVLEIEHTYYEGDTITSSVLEGFSVPVNDIF
jgi:Uma2 family endonuclease